MLSAFSTDNDFGHDRQMKEPCCGIAQQCHLYYQRRPSHSCTGYEPPVRSECHIFISSYTCTDTQIICYCNNYYLLYLNKS